MSSPILRTSPFFGLNPFFSDLVSSTSFSRDPNTLGFSAFIFVRRLHRIIGFGYETELFATQIQIASSYIHVYMHICWANERLFGIFNPRCKVMSS